MAKNLVKNALSKNLDVKTGGRGNNYHKLERIVKQKQEILAKNSQAWIIDLASDEPDSMADPKVNHVLFEEASKWVNRGPSNNGIEEFNLAVSNYMDKVYGVGNINPKTEVNHAMGRKSALAILAQTFINPGDVCICLAPASQDFTDISNLLGASIYKLHINKENKFMPDFTKIPSEVSKKAKILYLNYPNSPTGAVANKAFFRRAIKYAKTNEMIIINDAKDAALVYDDYAPLSLLSVAGAKSISVEVHSLSRAFNMAGWNLAFVIGSKNIIEAFRNVKSMNDCGQFKPIQYAGARALYSPEITDQTLVKYSRRLDKLVGVLTEIGFKAEKPKAGTYLYLPIPKGIKGGPSFKSAEKFSEYLLKEKFISTMPWDDSGSYVGFSVTYLALNDMEEDNLMEEIRRRLSDIEFIF